MSLHKHTAQQHLVFPHHSDSDSSLGARTEQEALGQGGYHPVNIGDTFKKGTYRTLCRLGCGHFSTVWLCLDYSRVNRSNPDVHKVVALKIQKSAIDYSEAAKDEIKLLKACHAHNIHIINLIDHFEHFGPNGTHICLVFDVLGVSLLKLIKRFNYNGSPLPLIRRISKYMLQGLFFLHSTVGIIHTDLKPENVLFELPSHVVDQIELEATQFAHLLKYRKQQDHLLHQQLFKAKKDFLKTKGIEWNPKKPSSNNENTSEDSSTAVAPANMSKSYRKNYKKRMRAKAKRLMASTIAANKDIANCPNDNTDKESSTLSKSNSANGNDNNGNGNDDNLKDIQNNHHHISAALPPAVPQQQQPAVLQYPQQVPKEEIQTRNSAAARDTKSSTGDLVNSSDNANGKSSSTTKCSSGGSKHDSKTSSKITQQIQPPQQQHEQHQCNNQQQIRVPSVGATTLPGIEALNDDATKSTNDARETNAKDTDDHTDTEEESERNEKDHASSDNKKNKNKNEKETDNSEDQDEEDTKPNSIVNQVTHQPLSSTTSSVKTSATSTTSVPSFATPDKTTCSNEVPPQTPPPFSTQTGDAFDLRSIVENDAVFARGVVKIADLGNACWINKHFTDDIQTRQYRSPEVILGIKYHTPVDIWSAACVIFELLTGDYLFDPHTGAGYDRDEDHLALMIELLGAMPKYMTRRGEFSKDLFNRNGELRMIKKLDFFPLQEVLEDKYKMNKADADLITSFLLPMLRLDPMKRATAQECLAHPFCAEVDSDVPCSPSSSSPVKKKHDESVSDCSASNSSNSNDHGNDNGTKSKSKCHVDTAAKQSKDNDLGDAKHDAINNKSYNNQLKSNESIAIHNDSTPNKGAIFTPDDSSGANVSTRSI